MKKINDLILNSIQNILPTDFLISRIYGVQPTSLQSKGNNHLFLEQKCRSEIADKYHYFVMYKKVHVHKRKTIWFVQVTNTKITGCMLVLTFFKSGRET